MGVGSALISDAIVFSQDDKAISLIKEHLKLKGVPNIMICDDAGQAKEGTERFPSALVIVHWSEGYEQDCCKVLSSAQGKSKLDSRPLVLLTSKVSHSLVATAVEYGVTQLHVGEIDSKAIASKIGTAVRSMANQQEVKSLMKKVSRLRDKGTHEEASNLLAEQVKKTPHNLRLRCELAESYLQQKKFRECLNVVETMGELDPPYLRALHIGGRCLYLLGQNQEAQEWLSKAQLFNPHNSDRLVDLGYTYLKMYNPAQAEQQFEMALNIDDENSEAKRGVGACRLLENQVNEALELFKDTSSAQETASVFNLAAVVAMKSGRHSAGMSLYDSAMKAVGSDRTIMARLVFNKGVGFKRMGKPEEARNCFEEALKLDASYEKARESLEKHTQPTRAASDVDFADESLGFEDMSDLDIADDSGFSEEDDDDISTMKVI